MPPNDHNPPSTQPSGEPDPGNESSEFASELPRGAWKYIIVLALCLLAAPFILHGLKEVDPDRPEMSEPAPIRVTVSKHANLNIEDVEFTPQFLQGLEASLTRVALDTFKANMARLGHPPQYEPGIRSHVRLIDVEGKSLAVFRATIDDRFRVVIALGSQDETFLRVSCMRASNHEIPLLRGECGEALATAFGLDLHR